jgi:hypothetical protein
MSATQRLIIESRRKAVLKQLIAAGHEHFDMSNWYIAEGEKSLALDTKITGVNGIGLKWDVYGDDDTETMTGWQLGSTDFTQCGTTACFAGWIRLVAHECGEEIPKYDGTADFTDYKQIADWIGCDHKVFFQNQWDDIDDTGDLAARYDTFRVAGMSPQMSQWLVIIIYLTELIEVDA